MNARLDVCLIVVQYNTAARWIYKTYERSMTSWLCKRKWILDYNLVARISLPAFHLNCKSAIVWHVGLAEISIFHFQIFSIASLYLIFEEFLLVEKSYTSNYCRLIISQSMSRVLHSIFDASQWSKNCVSTKRRSILSNHRDPLLASRATSLL